MKSITHLLAVTIIFCSTAYAQSDYNKWSVGIAVGGHDATTPSTKFTRLYQPHHYDLNLRYMANNRFGLMADAGYDFLDFYNSPYNSHYMRYSLQAVVNAGDLLNFQSFTKRFGVLAHGGAGGSYLWQNREAADGSTIKKGDNMLHAIIGVTPQFKLNEKWSVKADVSGIIHHKQNNKFDFRGRPTPRVITGALATVSVGLTYYIGKHATHADWVPTVYGQKGNPELEKRIAELEEQLKDDDKDGVRNNIDREPATPSGVVVNSLGEEIKVTAPADTDGDGFTDNVDDCINVRGSLNGCPDRDGDAVPDYRDNCPDEAGTLEHNGCALSKTTLDIIQKASEAIYFSTGSDEIKQLSFSELDKLADILKEHPEVVVRIEGHTDNVGGDEKNLELSKARALAVKKFLVSKGIDAARLSSEGYGSQKPIADNSTEVGQAQNRRVVISTSTYTQKVKVTEEEK